MQYKLSRRTGQDTTEDVILDERTYVNRFSTVEQLILLDGGEVCSAGAMWKLIVGTATPEDQS